MRREKPMPEKPAASAFISDCNVAGRLNLKKQDFRKYARAG